MGGGGRERRAGRAAVVLVGGCATRGVGLAGAEALAFAEQKARLAAADAERRCAEVRRGHEEPFAAGAEPRQ